MVHVQNATLAGGVAMGNSANLIVSPYGSLITGGIAGAISTLSYQYLQGYLQKRIGLHDTGGVLSLHGLPGIYAALASAVFCYLATPDVYMDSQTILFGSRDPATEQAPMQVAAMAASLG